MLARARAGTRAARKFWRFSSKGQNAQKPRDGKNPQNGQKHFGFWERPTFLKSGQKFRAFKILPSDYAKRARGRGGEEGARGRATAEDGGGGETPPPFLPSLPGRCRYAHPRNQVSAAAPAVGVLATL